jgi:hypothetical protein
MLVSFLPFRSSATIFVLVCDTEHVWIGADSRSMKKDKVSDSACKITQAGRFFIVQAGLLETSTNSGFLGLRIKEAVIPAMDAKQFMPSFRSQVTLEFTRLLRVNHKYFPSDYSTLMSRDTNCLAILALCGFEKDRTEIQMNTWAVNIETNGIPSAFVRVETISPKEMVFKAIGENYDIYNALLHGDPKWIKLAQERDAIGLIRYATELSMHPSDIGDAIPVAGGPIDILKIEPTGACWIQRKKECLEIEPF